MGDSLIFDGVKYISSKQAAETTGYAKDYIGQMCRAGKVDARLVGRNWYVSERSLMQYQEQKKGARALADKESLKRGEELLSRTHVSVQRDIPLYHVEVDERPLNPEPRKEIPIKRDTAFRPTALVKDTTVVQKRMPHVSVGDDLVLHRKVRREEIKSRVKKGSGMKIALAAVVLTLIAGSMIFESQFRYLANTEVMETTLRVQEDILALVVRLSEPISFLRQD